VVARQSTNIRFLFKINTSFCFKEKNTKLFFLFSKRALFYVLSFF